MIESGEVLALLQSFLAAVVFPELLMVFYAHSLYACF